MLGGCVLLFGNKIYCTVINCKYHTNNDRCSKKHIHISSHESIARDFRTTDCMSFEHKAP